MEKKKTKKKIIIGIVAVAVILAGAVGYMVFKDMKQEDILRAEIKNLSSKSVIKDRYNTTIVTKGDYAVVEKAIKTYLDTYAKTTQEVLKIMDDEQLTNLLSASNYSSDGPDFVKTKEYINTTKQTFNEKLTKLTDMTSEATIMKNIESKNLDKYYVNLYKELMLNGIAENDFESSKSELKTASDKINNILNVQEEVINLLYANKGKWSVQSDKIVFQDTNTLNQYNTLISELSK